MGDWKSYIEGFYRRPPEEQERLWAELTEEQKAAFRAAYQEVKTPSAAVDDSDKTLATELDELVHIGEDLLASCGFWGIPRIRYQDYAGWRLRSISAVRELGPAAEHLLPTLENRWAAHNMVKAYVQQIQGAVVAAQTLVKRFPRLGQMPSPDPTQSPTPSASPSSSQARASAETSAGSNGEAIQDGSVFLVHGHDHTALQLTARLVEHLGLRPVILFEQPAKGRTIIEKLEQSSVTSAAIVLLTPDDVGARAAEPEALKPRARQNVILELGYFLGLLGRHRVVVLYAEGVELPSDYVGVEYIKLDGEGAWRLRVARELRAAGLEVDLNKL